MVTQVKKHVLVSVVIPAYNCAETLAQTVSSVFRDACKDVEVIIIDDGSVDNTGQLMTELQSQYKPNIKVAHQPNSGGNVARNRGIDLASGDYIQFLDADDRLMNDKLARSVKAFQANERLSCVYTDGCVNGDRNLSIEAAHNNLIAIANNRFDEFTFALNTNMPMFKSSFLQESGERWDENLSCWQESEYFFRLMLSLESCQNVLHIPLIGFSRTLSPHGIGHNQNTSRYVENKLKAILKIYQLCIDNGLNNTKLENQFNGFLWLLYKQCVLQELDSLLPVISRQHKNKSFIQSTIQKIPASIIRLTYNFLFRVKSELSRVLG